MLYCFYIYLFNPNSNPIGGQGLTGYPVVCGGIQNSSYSNEVFDLKNNEWVLSSRMNSERVQLQDGTILVTGGYYESGLIIHIIISFIFKKVCF
jgi:hypothetical protein